MRTTEPFRNKPFQRFGIPPIGTNLGNALDIKVNDTDIEYRFMTCVAVNDRERHTPGPKI